MPTPTPNYALLKPTVGADDDVWGGMWNGNADIIDSALAAQVEKAGDTMSGALYLPAATPTNPQQAATKAYVDALIGSGGASVTISDTAPSSPEVGDLWFDSTILTLLTWYDDGTSSQWVQTVPSGSSTPPADPESMTLVTVTGTTQTPTIDQSKAYFLCTNAAGCAVTIPTNAAVAYPLLTLLTYEQNNTGALTFTGASGVTINAPSTHLKATVDRYSVVQLCKVGTDVWTLYGNLDPV